MAITFDTHSQCRGCKGKGTKRRGKYLNTCTQCKGTGVVVREGAGCMHECMCTRVAISNELFCVACDALECDVIRAGW